MFILSSLLLHLYLVYLALFSAFCSFKSYLTFNIKTTRVGCKQEVQSKLRVNKMRNGYLLSCRSWCTGVHTCTQLFKNSNNLRTGFKNRHEQF